MAAKRYQTIEFPHSAHGWQIERLRQYVGVVEEDNVSNDWKEMITEFNYGIFSDKSSFSVAEVANGGGERQGNCFTFALILHRNS